MVDIAPNGGQLPGKGFDIRGVQIDDIPVNRHLPKIGPHPLGRELGQLLDAFLRTLTPDNQMVFLRRYWYVDTIAEIAARYGISESAVQMRLNRTKQKLSAYLAKEGIRV